MPMALPVTPGDGGSGRAFSVSRFWKRVVQLDADDDVAVDGDRRNGGSNDGNETGCVSFEELLNHARRKQHKKRRLGRLQFTIAQHAAEAGAEPELDGSDESCLTFSVGLFSNVAIEAKPPPVKLNARTNELIKSHTRTVNEVRAGAAANLRFVYTPTPPRASWKS